MTLRVHLLLLTLLTLLLTTACAPIAAPAPAATATATGPAALPLADTAGLGDSGFVMDVPDGWDAYSDGRTTTIEDEPNACAQQNALCIVHDQRELDFFRAMGLPAADATLDDMLAIGRKVFLWEELSEPETRELFGVPAIGLRYNDEEGRVWGYIYLGLLPDAGFMLNLSAPGEAELDAILPTFEAMLATIRPAQ